MMARQQFARLLALAAVVALAIIGLRGQVPGPRWDGPLKAHGVIIGIALEVILGALLLSTIYREHAARRKADEALLADSAARASAGWITAPPAAPCPPAPRPPAAAAPNDDRDVAAALRFLLRLVIGTAMAAIGVVLAVNAHLHLFTARPMIARPIKVHTFGPPRTQLPTRTGTGLHFHFPVAPVLYGLLTVALMAALGFSVWWGRRLAAARPAAVPGDLAEETEGLREAVASGRAAMADLDDARAAIIACYAAMERSLAERGAERGAAGTPDELLDRAVRSGLLSAGDDSGGHDSAGPDNAGPDNAARTLTALFYEARFSTHPLGPGHRDTAARALDELAAELSQAGAGPRPAGAGR
jgi:hypothetical protein